MSNMLPRGYDGSKDGQLATSEWLAPDKLNALVREGTFGYEPHKLWLGRTLDDDALPVGYTDDRHWLTIAGSRAGKGTTAIIPVLAEYPGSVLCVDPKGENASITAARRGHGSSSIDGLHQDVHVLDPFRVADVNEDDRSSFNPLRLIRANDCEAVEDAALIAEALVVSANDKDAHWDDSAKNWITALVLHVVSWPSFEDRSLRTVRRLLLEGDVEEAARRDQSAPPAGGKKHSPFGTLLRTMIENTAFDGLVSSAAHGMYGLGDRERSTILSTARRNTAFLDSKMMQECLEDGERRLNLDDLKLAPRGVSVFLVLPARRMGTHARWLRLVLNLAVSRMEAVRQTPAQGAPVLAVLDEMYQLGHMPILESAAGYMAGFGLKLWSIWQDLGQLKRHYPSTYETFLANASVLQVFGVTDLTTTSYISQRAGEMEIQMVSESESTSESKSFSDISDYDKALRSEADGVLARLSRSIAMDDTTGTMSASEGKSTSISTSLSKSPLVTPDEITRCFARETLLQLILVSGYRPIAVRRSSYFEDKYFRNKFVVPWSDQGPA